ncbi:ABC transporter permease [Propionicicella superfundia]|uniref:ABC transporter permease n=1 Tax=Propionicicella superfundia TaxID=348582 RepID=UPI0004236D29|nr:ABC transporter permease [Propionicicella superfundia]
MTRSIGVRALRMLLTILLVTLVAFLLTKVAYANPARSLAPENASPETVAQIAASLGLDEPWWVQLRYFLFGGPAIKGVRTGLFTVPPSLGYSFREQRPVLDLILEKIPVTASLAIGALVIWMTISILSGVLATRRPQGLFDRASSTVSYALLSLPVFVTGVLLLYFGYYRLTLAGIDVFPSGGYVPLTESPGQWARHLVLPWLTLVLYEVGVFQRVVRGAVLDVSSYDFIRTARAKGAGWWRVSFGHALPGALTPILTLAGIEFASILGGAIVTEQIFGLDGVGRLAVRAALTGDGPVVIGCTLFAAVVFVVITAAVDIVIDVRARRAR